MTLLVLLAAALILCSALSSMAEAALFSVPLAKVHVAVEEKRHGSRRLLAIKKNLQRPVAALVILNNTFNIAGSIGIGWLAEHTYGSAAVGIVSAVLTFLIIVFAEILPKTLGERNALGVALTTAPLVTALTRILAPLIWLIGRVIRPFASSAPVIAASEDEIRILASLGNEAGHISRHENELIRRAFLLNDVTAKDIMTHRTKLTYLPADTPISRLHPADVEVSHSRILVADGDDLDRINGVIYLRDILLALAQDKTQLTVGELKKPVVFVHESFPAHRLLVQFQRSRQHLFVVVDEYGGTSGVVSLEDVLEELVGEIHDETDDPPDGQPRTPRTQSGPPARPAAPKDAGTGGSASVQAKIQPAAPLPAAREG
jgi:CBS domain containing-hemolysin-like protein